jgi:ribosomal protein S18 acetylase RimI-like enzyme
MTTTLRPLSPELPAPYGGRGRLFAVCVNGRPVGRVTVTARAAEEGGGSRVGEITALGIDPADRGRGRGTVAALAAEEVLRGWGCARARAEIEQGPDQAAALRLAEALGYTLRARHLAKQLPDSLPELPSGVRGRPLTAEEFADWLAAETERCVAAETSWGSAPGPARRRVELALREALPHGPRTPGTVLRSLEVSGLGTSGQQASGQQASGLGIGSIWLDTSTGRLTEHPRPAWVFSVVVAEQHRGQGHGRSLMLLAERECLDVGVRRLGLNVDADNAPANALYRSLGYRTTRHILDKVL